MKQGIVFCIAALAVSGAASSLMADDEVSQILGGQPVPIEELAEARGGTLTTVDADFASLTAQISNATSNINGTFNATNSIAADAFQNAAGAFTVIQNNGDNSIIQVNTMLHVIVQ